MLPGNSGLPWDNLTMNPGASAFHSAHQTRAEFVPVPGAWPLAPHPQIVTSEVRMQKATRRGAARESGRRVQLLQRVAVNTWQIGCGTMPVHRPANTPGNKKRGSAPGTDLTAVLTSQQHCQIRPELPRSRHFLIWQNHNLMRWFHWHA